MLIGNYPVADTLESDDILIISKDGVHLMQISAYSAGVGGGLRWWKETETRIEHEKLLGNGSGVSTGQRATIKIHGGWTFEGTKWHDHYFVTEEMYANACFPASDVSGEQPKSIVEDVSTDLYTKDIWYEEDPLDMDYATLKPQQMTTIKDYNDDRNHGHISTRIHIPYCKTFPHLYYSIGYMNGVFSSITENTQIDMKGTTGAIYDSLKANYGRDASYTSYTALKNTPSPSGANPSYGAGMNYDHTFDNMSTNVELPYLFLVSCVGKNYDESSAAFSMSFNKITSDKNDPNDETHYVGQMYVTRGTDSILGDHRRLIEYWTDTKTNTPITHDLGLPSVISVYVMHSGCMWNVTMMPLYDEDWRSTFPGTSGKVPMMEGEYDNWRERICLSDDTPIGDVPNFLGNIGEHPTYRHFDELSPYIERVADIQLYESHEEIHGVMHDHYQVLNKSTWRTKDGNDTQLIQFIVSNAQETALKVIDAMKLKAYHASGYEDSAKDYLYTNIGVNENEGFRTGIKHDIAGEPEPIFECKASIDPVTGDGKFGTLYEGGPTVDKAKRLQDKYQLKLKAGPGINITNQDDEDYTKPRVISSDAVDKFVDLLEESLDVGNGLSLTQDENGVFTYALNQVIRPKPVSGDDDVKIVGISNHHYVGAGGQDINELYFEAGDDFLTYLGVPKFTTGIGIELTPWSDNYTIISTTAITEVRVDNEPLPATVVPADQSNPAKRYVNIDTSMWGGSGEDTTIPSPIPNYAERELITSFYAVDHEYTALTDGYLFLEARNSSLFYCKVQVDGMYYYFGNMNNATNQRCISDTSNMIPLYKGQKVKLIEKTANVNISTSAYATGVNKFWFIPMVRQGTNVDAYTIGYFVYSSTAIGAISSNSIKIDGAQDPYVYTAEYDSVITSSTSANTAGVVYIYPLDKDNNSLGQYELQRVPASGTQRPENSQFLLKKGQKYRITKSNSSNTSETYSIYALNYVTKSNFDAGNAMPSPFLDWHKAETIDLASGYESTWVDIPAPVQTETPGILFIDGVNVFPDEIKELQVQFGSGTKGKTKLYYRGSTSQRNYIRVPGYNASYDSLRWKYYKDFNYFDPCRLVFVPFRTYKKPGVDHVVVNYDFIENNGIVDLSYLYNKIADLEARVAALENPT